ncbi:hypothetical protein [Frateuria aurantia]|uniref:DUF4168 domain-containing protein n=1 Tax=Frateuria aurantia (strain ATCC 33424 / DSM 6220 / KCTC 2777 / LMG 1558 / NBRC 3245 / NCIMB 13370) TaxID=767434 RepID=H8L6I3_FRAAD|nr:hypothetical protein [Frateuria aurantia]AFC85972.1 hypothetical protein Fraau_1553 [Frateuria aurantia DSM 6220]
MRFSSRRGAPRISSRWLRGSMVLLLSVAPLAYAQQGGGPPLPAADLQAIDRYTLNEDVLQRLMAVVKEGHALGIHPTQPAADQQREPYSLDAIAAQAVAADPRIAPLLARYGFTPRQFLLTNMAMSTAALAVQAKQHPELAGYVAGRHINPANVAFYETHLTEIAAFLRSQQGAADPAGTGTAAGSQSGS